MVFGLLSLSRISVAIALASSGLRTKSTIRLPTETVCQLDRRVSQRCVKLFRLYRRSDSQCFLCIPALADNRVRSIFVG